MDDARRTAPPSPVPAPAPPPGEGCPAPLSAAEVLEAFRRDADAWRVDRGSYELTGRTWGSGPPIYFLGGLAGTSDLFAPLAYLLRDQFRCVLCEYPPVNRSTSASIDTLASDLLAAADHHQDREFAAFATSFGGLVALTAMAESPRVSRAVLHAAFAHRRLSAAERLLLRLAARTRRPLDRAPLWLRIQEQNHRPWFPPFDAVRWPLYVENAGATPAREFARRAALLGRTDLRPRLPQVRQPVLLIRTEGEGRVLARRQEELAAGLPAARTEWLHTTGSLAYLTHPHRVAKLIREFLAAPTVPGAADPATTGHRRP